MKCGKFMLQKMSSQQNFLSLDTVGIVAWYLDFKNLFNFRLVCSDWNFVIHPYVCILLKAPWIPDDFKIWKFWTEKFRGLLVEYCDVLNCAQTVAVYHKTSGPVTLQNRLNLFAYVEKRRLGSKIKHLTNRTEKEMLRTLYRINSSVQYDYNLSWTKFSRIVLKHPDAGVALIKILLKKELNYEERNLKSILEFLKPDFTLDMIMKFQQKFQEEFKQYFIEFLSTTKQKPCKHIDFPDLRKMSLNDLKYYQSLPNFFGYLYHTLSEAILSYYLENVKTAVEFLTTYFAMTSLPDNFVDKSYRKTNPRTILYLLKTFNSKNKFHISLVLSAFNNHENSMESQQETIDLLEYYITNSTSFYRAEMTSFTLGVITACRPFFKQPGEKPKMLRNIELIVLNCNINLLEKYFIYNIITNSATELEWFIEIMEKQIKHNNQDQYHYFCEGTDLVDLSQ